jgi:hypothetical protein
LPLPHPSLDTPKKRFPFWKPNKNTETHALVCNFVTHFAVFFKPFVRKTEQKGIR